MVLSVLCDIKFKYFWFHEIFPRKMIFFKLFFLILKICLENLSPDIYFRNYFQMTSIWKSTWISDPLSIHLSFSKVNEEKNFEIFDWIRHYFNSRRARLLYYFRPFIRIKSGSVLFDWERNWRKILFIQLALKYWT